MSIMTGSRSASVQSQTPRNVRFENESGMDGAKAEVLKSGKTQYLN